MGQRVVKKRCAYEKKETNWREYDVRKKKPGLRADQWYFSTEQICLSPGHPDEINKLHNRERI